MEFADSSEEEGMIKAGKPLSIRRSPPTYPTSPKLPSKGGRGGNEGAANMYDCRPCIKQQLLYNALYDT